MIERKIRRLFWDIETSPNIVLSWRTGYQITLNPENILKERAVICIAYKWEGEETVHSLRWDARQSDRAMLRAFARVAAQADELVAHNGDRYDIAWLRTRLLKHGLPVPPKYKTVDTLAWARRLFMFNSNKLDYIAQFLGVGAKLKTGFSLWYEIVVNRDEPALDRMVEYCEQDVRVLEAVWRKLRLYAEPKTHAGVVAGGEKWTCPHCGSKDVVKSKTLITAGGTIRHQMKCKKDGSYFTIGDAAFKRYLAR